MYPERLDDGLGALLALIRGRRGLGIMPVHNVNFDPNRPCTYRQKFGWLLLSV